MQLLKHKGKDFIKNAEDNRKIQSFSLRFKKKIKNTKIIPFPQSLQGN